MKTLNPPIWAGLDTRAGYFLTRLNPDGQTKRIVARFDNESTVAEQIEVFRACNSHAANADRMSEALEMLQGNPSPEAIDTVRAMLSAALQSAK